MRDIRVDRIMTTAPTSIAPGDKAFDAYQRLAAGHIHHLPVVDADNRLIGIVSSSDFLKLYLLKGKANKATVAHIMQEDPVAIESTANLRDAAIRLSDGGFHALPVVDPDRTLVGIVTSSDLIVHLLQSIPSGDGSLRDTTPQSGAGTSISDEDLALALKAAQATVDRGADDPSARALLALRDRNRVLTQVCQAAELYIRSGNGEHEHSVLVKRLADARSQAETTL